MNPGWSPTSTTCPGAVSIGKQGGRTGRTGDGSEFGHFNGENEDQPVDFIVSTVFSDQKLDQKLGEIKT